MDISKNIKRIRIKKGLTQLHAAKMCGMLEPQYRRYENGKSNPRASTVERIASALNVPVSELYKQPKYPVQYADNLAPFCPVCGSAEYMENPDGNENSYCGKCGTLLDWENMENVDAVDV